MLFMLTFQSSDEQASIGWGYLLAIYVIPASIAIMITANNQIKNNDEFFTEKLLDLNNLKEKGIITEEEFQRKKRKIMGH